MKTIKSRIMDIIKEIDEDDSRSFAEHKFFKEYLGSKIINYRRKSDKKLIMKIYKTKYKKGTEIFIDNTSYYLNVIDGITIIYNEKGKAVSISFADGFEWTGESLISEQDIVIENDFRVKYQNFINEAKKSNDLKKMYNDSRELLNILKNITCICDTTKIFNNLKSIYNYYNNYLYGNVEEYFNDKLNKIKDLNNTFEAYFKQEKEIEYALNSLREYYKWLINIENVNKNRLNSSDSFFKLVNDMKDHINKLFRKMTISQNDWDLLEYYHDEIEEMLANKKQLITDLSEKNRNNNVTNEGINLNEDKSKNSQTIDKPKSKNLFKKITVGEKADYLTFKALRKYGVEEYQFNAEKISVKKAKKELKQFNKIQNKYEKLFNKDHSSEIDEVSHEIYNTIKSAKENLVNTGIQDEKNSDEIFNNTLRNNYNRSIYLKRQQDLKNSASIINKITNILWNISDDNFEKIKANYKKVKRRLIGIGAGICAGALVITSFGAGSYKNYRNNLKNNAIVYENDDTYININDNQELNSDICSEKILVGFGAESKETETKKQEETEKNEVVTESSSEKILVGFGAESKETETKKQEEIEKNEVVTESSSKKIQDNYDDPSVSNTNLNIESIKEDEISEAKHNKPTIEVSEVKETSSKLNEIKDEKNLLNTYKNELQNLNSLLPQSNIEIENIRNIGDVVNITTDANLQYDEYSLIKHSEGYKSIYKDTIPRVICSIIMSDGNSGITAKTMEEAESLLEQGYYVAGYGLLNPYSKDTNNLEGFFESEDIVGLVRK